MANSKKKTVPDAEIRTQQLGKVREIIVRLKSERGSLSEAKTKQLSLLESVSLGLYVEIDKLSKKAPAEPVTDLVLRQMNDVIRETRELIPNDTYVQRLSEFVAAGDNPQHRDAIVVLKLVRQGLERYRQYVNGTKERIDRLIAEARQIEAALGYYLENEDWPDRRSIKAPLGWAWERDSDDEFDFQRLDDTDLDQHFSLG